MVKMRRSRKLPAEAPEALQNRGTERTAALERANEELKAAQAELRPAVPVLSVNAISREQTMSSVVRPQLLTPSEAAKFLGLDSPGTLAVWRCTKRYDLPYIKVGHKIMYDIADLLAFLESRKVRLA